MTISAILVITAPPAQPAVSGAVAALGWAEVHDRAADGRMIVTLEAESSEQGMERLMAIKRLPGVLSAELVIHCFEDEAPAGQRYDCLLCHAPQASNVAPLVENTFRPQGPSDARKDVLDSLNSTGKF